MAYSRFIISDVYVFASSDGVHCCACTLIESMDGASFVAKSTQQIVDHLTIHKSLGHNVPEDVFDNLWQDDSKNF